MTNRFEENKKLNEMIDTYSPSFYALSKQMNIGQMELMDKLSELYDKALAEGNVVYDSDGISFETTFSSITLKPNQDFSSSYDYYLAFQLKMPADEYAEEAIEEVQVEAEEEPSKEIVAEAEIVEEKAEEPVNEELEDYEVEDSAEEAETEVELPESLDEAYLRRAALHTSTIW